MKQYHILFFLFKFFILCIVGMIALHVISVDQHIMIFIDSLFKLSVGFFLIFFFSTNQTCQIDKYDRILFIFTGLILLLLIDYPYLYRKSQ